jgi:hypothetical protein
MAQPCPAVVTLDNALKNSIPFLKDNFKDALGPSKRTQIMTGSGRHETGLALDIFLFATPWYKDKTIDHVNEKKLGENLVKVFIDLKNSMQWTEMIYQKRIFIAPDRYIPWTKDDAHNTHIHIDWMTNEYKGKGKSPEFNVEHSPQGKTTEFSSVLTARLDQLYAQWESKTLNSVEIASIYPVYTPQTNPAGKWKVISQPWYGNYEIFPNGTVNWDDTNSKSGSGKWTITGNTIEFTWANSKTTERWKLPITQSKLTGIVTMAGKKYDVEATKA